MLLFVFPQGKTSGLMTYPDSTMKGSMTMTARPATSVDLDALVKQMITEGPENVSCPPGLSAYDFEQIQELMDDVIVCYQSRDLSAQLTIPWQMGAYGKDKLSMMEFIKARDYESAHWAWRLDGEIIL